MNRILAAITAALTVTFSTGASASLASVVDAPNNSLASEALGSVASQPSCDDPFVAPGMRAGKSVQRQTDNSD